MKDHNTVIMVHGIYDTHKRMLPLERHLKGQNREVYSMDLKPNNGSADLKVLAQQLAEFIKQHARPDKKIDVIAFSMGGLIARYYVQKMKGFQKVENFITISSPNNGTLWAKLSNRTGIQQMRQHSHFLNELNQDMEVLKPLNFLSIYTPFDLIIVPARSSIIEGLSYKMIPALAHPMMMKNKSCFAMIDQTLAK